MKKSNNTTATHTTFAALCKSATTAPVQVHFKQLNALMLEDEADTTAIRWHLTAANMKLFGGACVTFADADKTALVVAATPKKAKAADTLTTIFANAANVAAATDALTNATTKGAKNAAAVANVATATDALTADIVAYKAKADEKAAARQEREAAARQRVIDYLTANGLTADEAVTKADNVAIIDGIKADNGRYCFTLKAVLASFEYTFADALTAARQNVADTDAKAKADAKAEADAAKAAEKAKADAAAVAQYKMNLAVVRPLCGGDEAKAEKAAFAALTTKEKAAVTRWRKANAVDMTGEATTPARQAVGA